MGDAHHGLINGICCLVWEDARGETGDHLLHPTLICRMQDIVIDVDVPPLGTQRHLSVSLTKGWWNHQILRHMVMIH